MNERVSVTIFDLHNNSSLALAGGRHAAQQRPHSQRVATTKSTRRKRYFVGIYKILRIKCRLATLQKSMHACTFPTDNDPTSHSQPHICAHASVTDRRTSAKPQSRRRLERYNLSSTVTV